MSRSAEDTVPDLNLVNFDGVEYEGSHYVLTSPRSLEACARCGVKPIDLLYKSLDDFKTMHGKLSDRDTFELYDESESIRKDKLRHARLERERIIDEINDGVGKFDDFGVVGRSMSKRTSSYSSESDFRRKTSSSKSKKQNGVKLKDKDAKILQLMKARQKEEDEQYARALVEERDFADKQKRAARERERRETETRSAVELRRRQQELDRQAQMLEQAAAAETDQELRTQQLREAERKAESRLKEQRKTMASKVLSKQRELAKKQARSAQNLVAQEEEVAKYHDEVLKYSEEALSRASAQKLRRELDFLQQKRDENEEKRKEFMERQEEMHRSTVEDTEMFRSSVEQRHKLAEKNLKKLEKDRYRCISESRADRRRREQDTADKRQLLEAEVEDYREELRQYTQQSAQRAEEIAKTRLALKAARAAGTEKHRLAVAKLNKQEQDQVEQEWSLQTAHLAQIKQERAERLARQREKQQLEARQYSRRAEHMREDMRRSQETFDKKVQQVELVNKMGLGW